MAVVCLQVAVDRAPLVQEVECLSRLDTDVFAHFKDFTYIILQTLLVLEVTAGCDDSLVLNWKSVEFVQGCDLLFELQVLQRLHLQQFSIEFSADFLLDELNQALSSCFL